MSFIDDDEYVLLMDMPNFAQVMPAWPMHPDDVKLCFSAGMRTATQFLYWHDIEKAKGSYDWTNLEEGIERILSSGMKLILYTYNYPPDYFDEDWYQKDENGNKVLALSLWSQEAQDYEHNFMRLVMERYKDRNILFVNSLQRDGETVMSLNPCIFDREAVRSHNTYTGLSAPDIHSRLTWEWFRKSIVDTVINQQEVLLRYQNHQEVWQNYHRVIIAKWCGNEFITDLYQKYREIWGKTVDINVTQFTWTPHGDGYKLEIQRDTKLWDLKVWGGAEHCEGIMNSTQQGIKFDVRGLICAPVSYWNKKTRVEPWMLDNIRRSIDMWKAPR
jgi:hypothetical protein